MESTRALSDDSLGYGIPSEAIRIRQIYLKTLEMGNTGTKVKGWPRAVVDGWRRKGSEKGRRSRSVGLGDADGRRGPKRWGTWWYRWFSRCLEGQSKGRTRENRIPI